MHFVQQLNIFKVNLYCLHRHSGIFSEVLKDVLDVIMTSEVLYIIYSEKSTNLVMMHFAHQQIIFNANSYCCHRHSGFFSVF